MLSRYQAILSRLSRPVYPVRDALSMLHFPGCPVQSIPSWISCPLSSLSCLGYPVQVVYTVLSISCPGGPVHCLVSSSSISCLQAILSRLSCPVYLCSISCPGYRVKTIRSSLSVQYSTYILSTVTRLSCKSNPVQATLYRLSSCPVYPAQAIMSNLSCPVYTSLAIMSSLSCPVYPSQAILSSLSCPAWLFCSAFSGQFF